MQRNALYFLLAFPELGENFTLLVSLLLLVKLVSFFIKRVRATTQSAVSSDWGHTQKNESNQIEGELDGNGAGERKKRMLQFC